MPHRSAIPADDLPTKALCSAARSSNVRKRIHFGLSGKGAEEIRTASQSAPNFPRPAKRPIKLALSLRLISKIVASPAGERPPHEAQSRASGDHNQGTETSRGPLALPGAPAKVGAQFGAHLFQNSSQFVTIGSSAVQSVDRTNGAAEPTPLVR